MSVAERERYIVDGAITFFAEHGFDAQMRELAAAIGVPHTLVYHYFPTKQALVDRVYREVFEGRWRPEWETLLDDPAMGVEDKMVSFYADYARTVLTREFVRILIFSGLTDRSITDRFFGMLGKRLFPRLIRETRRFRGVKSRARPNVREYELLMGLHGGVFLAACVGSCTARRFTPTSLPSTTKPPLPTACAAIWRLAAACHPIRQPAEGVLSPAAGAARSAWPRRLAAGRS